MRNDAEALQTLRLTLEKYKKNLTLVPKSDLEGRYKAPFEKLKEQIKSELQEYLRQSVFYDIQIAADDAEAEAQKINEMYKDMNLAKRIGTAAYKNCDIDEIIGIACELREAVLRLYGKYLDKHTCLYAQAACFDAEAPQTPLIYNDVLNKFWDTQRCEWREARQEERKPAALIYIGR